MKVKYMSVDAHLLIPMKKGETQEQAEDRMIDALMEVNINRVDGGIGCIMKKMMVGFVRSRIAVRKNSTFDVRVEARCTS